MTKDMPTAAPAPVDIGGGKKFTPLYLHHAAPFAATRWTNLYFPARCGFFGDFVGGPLKSVFGSGIRDVKVRTRSLAGFANYSLLAHTRYWHLGDASHETERRDGPQLSLLALREALTLSLRKHSPTLAKDTEEPGLPQKTPPRFDVGAD